MVPQKVFMNILFLLYQSLILNPHFVSKYLVEYLDVFEINIALKEFVSFTSAADYFGSLH